MKIHCKYYFKGEEKIMKKRVLLVAGVLGMALMTGCGNKEAKEPVESVATTPTGMDSQETSEEANETSEGTEEVVVEVNTDLDYSVFKAPETISDDAGEYVVMYGMIGNHLEDGSYEVNTANGLFVFSLNDDTIIEEGVELVNDTYVEVINTGVVTMSMPGQISNVLEVKVVNAEDVLAEGRTIEEFYGASSNPEDVVLIEDVDYTVYPEVEYNEDKTEAIFYGEVKAILESDEGLQYTVDTANGTKVFNVSADVVKDNIENGNYIKAVTDGTETRSIPGILSNVSVFEIAEDDVIATIEDNKKANDTNVETNDTEKELANPLDIETETVEETTEEAASSEAQ